MSSDMPQYVRLSIRAALQLFDPNITHHNLNIDELYTSGKITYDDPKQINANGSGFVTRKVVKFVPMKFVQAVQIYEQLAKTAAATKTSPPCIAL